MKIQHFWWMKIPIVGIPTSKIGKFKKQCIEIRKCNNYYMAKRHVNVKLES